MRDVVKDSNSICGFTHETLNAILKIPFSTQCSHTKSPRSVASLRSDIDLHLRSKIPNVYISTHQLRNSPCTQSSEGSKRKSSYSKIGRFSLSSHTSITPIFRKGGPPKHPAQDQTIEVGKYLIERGRGLSPSMSSAFSNTPEKGPKKKNGRRNNIHVQDFQY